ncbi:hypothetical protein Q9L58_002258 [Maublancomyces gigas]|uniref:PPPDE domain-containing protein n=1 Tax=Discina gigas TaxID=1032678 RepID=A0ABR3GS98_9PEZI
MTSPTAPPKLQRGERNFYITIRTHTKPDAKETGCTDCEECVPVQKKPQWKTKFSKRAKTAVSSLADDLTMLVKQPHDQTGASKRVFEICKDLDGGTSDYSQSDRYASDEEYPTGIDSVKLGMKAGCEIKDTYSEPNYDILGGVCWRLLYSLKSQTRFTNSEIKHEAKRIWKRQRNYRLLDNNCQRFCILLAIYIRARQNTLLRMLNGKILKKQVGKTEKAFGGVSEFLRAGMEPR